MSHQEPLVDEVARHETLDQDPATHDCEARIRLLSFQLGYCVCGITLKKPWFGQGRGSVSVVEAMYLGRSFSTGVNGLSGWGVPEREEIPVSASPEEESASSSSHPLTHEAAHHLVIPRLRPASIRKTAAGVFICPPGALHDSIHGQMVHNGYRHLALPDL